MPQGDGVGFLGILLYPDTVLPHRVSVFLPFLFLMGAIVIGKAVSSPGWKRTAALVLAGAYVGINLWAYAYTDRTMTNELERAHVLAGLIREDVRANGLHQQEWQLIHRTTPETQAQYPYDGLRILYFLVENGTVHMPLTPEGNNFDFHVADPPPAPTMYLVCYNIDPAGIRESCTDPVLRQYPDHRIIRKREIGPDFFYILTASGKESSVSSQNRSGNAR